MKLSMILRINLHILIGEIAGPDRRFGLAYAWIDKVVKDRY
jgi:hypothetical protein